MSKAKEKKNPFKARIDINVLLPHFSIKLHESIDPFNIREVLENADYECAAEWLRDIVLGNVDQLSAQLMQRRRVSAPILETLEFRMEQDHIDIESDLFFKGRPTVQGVPATPTLTAKQCMELLRLLHGGTAPDVLADIETDTFYVRHNLKLLRRDNRTPVENSYVYARTPQEAVVLLVMSIYDFLRSHLANTVAVVGEDCEIHEFHRYVVNSLDLKEKESKKEEVQ